MPEAPPGAETGTTTAPPGAVAFWKRSPQNESRTMRELAEMSCPIPSTVLQAASPRRVTINKRRAIYSSAYHQMSGWNPIQSPYIGTVSG